MSVTLTYFDFDASRGLECRLALTAAGVDFEDNRIQRDQWLALKPTLPFGALPLLTDGDRQLCQTTTILRYIGSSHGMHPTDPWKAAQHDALMESVEDLRYKVPGSGMSDEEKKAAREAFAAGWLTRWATTVSESITGPFVDGDKLNVVDIKLYTILRSYINGVYDHIPASMFEQWPAITAFYAAVDAHPDIQRFFASR
ncbi:MAG: glutathione S-transferase [Myxococcota bacterium]|jgi:glutathione S-transferase